MLKRNRKILLVQLPIPPAGPSPIVGNVPLAAGYLIMFARKMGLTSHYEIEFLEPQLANYLSDAGIVEAILARDPWMVGFTCYLWNIDRTLWVAAALKARRPELLITLGGPEITGDNSWVLQSPAVDFAVVGEGEQTFSALLNSCRSGTDDEQPIAGLWRRSLPVVPAFRQPLPNLNEISSPYLEGILDAADEKLLLLETIRGCVFKCKFCYYPKSYDNLYFVSEEKIVANLRHARERGATEVVLLDPTLNQRRDFNDFLRLLARENPGQQFRYFGELRAEGINPETAKLLRAANFTEVEIGLQSIEPSAQALMDRRNNMKAFERGVAAMLDAGIAVKVDFIIGLPGDTVESVRRGFEYLAASKLFTTVQVFNLSILPGTAFRQEANSLGLRFQQRPPYYVLETPTLKTENLYELMSAAQEIFQLEWDLFPTPRLAFDNRSTQPTPLIQINLDDLAESTSQANRRQIVAVIAPRDEARVTERVGSTTTTPTPMRNLASSFVTRSDDGHSVVPVPAARSQALTVWFQGHEFSGHRAAMLRLLEQLLEDCPHSTLQIVLEPLGQPTAIDPSLPQSLLAACYQQPNYLDRYYSLNPSGLLGSKRILVLLDAELRERIDLEWLDSIGESATVVWVGGTFDETDLEPFEVAM